MNEVFVDSSIFIHLFDYLSKSDTAFSYDSVTQQYEELIESTRLITTNLVVSEALNHISKIVGKGGTYAWDWVMDYYRKYIATNLTIFELDNSIIESALSVCLEYKDYRFSFVDASCFVFLDRHGVVPVFTTDLSWSGYYYRKGHEYRAIPVIGYTPPQISEEPSGTGKPFRPGQ